ncbi:hypothetical protein GCM10012275_06950 [Longimycelium tulufanense]|uniref:Uncharacterized protein n=1 Tax=Longimycelium tulufanense TaxID=907463 RepID=A0A8J3C689_9PSEU|nr:hypothetical protein GCM10012275_06950 [Longimycelium tulufanense]
MRFKVGRDAETGRQDGGIGPVPVCLDHDVVDPDHETGSIVEHVPLPARDTGDVTGTANKTRDERVVGPGFAQHLRIVPSRTHADEVRAPGRASFGAALG